MGGPFPGASMPRVAPLLALSLLCALPALQARPTGYRNRKVQRRVDDPRQLRGGG